MKTDSMDKAADRVLYSSALFTGNADEPFAGALAVSGERIVWAGPRDMLPAHFIDSSTCVENWQDALLMPGFCDAHLHFFHSALYRSSLAERYVGENEADAVARLTPLAKRRPKDSWLLTQGWRDYLWSPPGMPSKQSLDAAYPNRPVAMYSGDAHTLWLNSCACRRLGIDEHSVAPEGGVYEKDSQGHLTGIVRESAAMQLMPRIVQGFSTEELKEAYCGFIAYLNECGITSVCDMSLMALPGLDFVRDDLFASLEKEGKLSVRVSMFPTLLEDRRRLSMLQKTYTGPRLRAAGFKQFFDGVSSQHTAWLKEPYANARFTGECGRASIAPEVLEAWVCAAAHEGNAVRIHAIGDKAIHNAIDIFKKYPPSKAHRFGGPVENPSQSMPAIHHTIEHLENFLPGDIERLAEAQIIASVQPMHISLDPGGPERDLGPQRTALMWPFRSLIDAGAVLAFGSDSPVADVNPMDAVYAAITRKDAYTHLPQGGWHPEQCITLAEALRAYTAGSAAAAGREGEVGCLEEGAFADIAVLSPNPFKLRACDVQKAQVQATYVGGKKVFGRNE